MKKLIIIPVLLLSVILSAQDKVKVACIGNSITFGASLSNPAKDSYPSVLGQMLGKGYEVRNFGISGRTMLSNGDLPYVSENAYLQALKFEPDIVVIKLGTNDSKPKNRIYLDEFIEDATAMADAFAALSSDPRILLCLPATVYNVKDGISDSVITARIIPAIREVGSRKGFEVIDVHSATAGMPGNFPDKIHPNAAGSIAIAKTVYTAITGEDIDFTTQAFPGVKSRWNGYDKYDFTYNGRSAVAVVPHDPLPGNPWIWRPAFFGAFPSVDTAMLGEGYHVVYYDVTFLYGSPRSQDMGDAFHAAMLKYYGLSPKVVLEGFSRGGLFAINWATRNPDKVSCIYLDAPVCDITSWPGRARDGLWAEFLAEWNLTEEDAVGFRGNPIDNLEPVAKADIPIIGVSGDSDRTVPYEENLGVLKERYEQLGGRIEVIIKPGCDHHPHSLEDPSPVVEFILACRERE